MSDRSDIVRRLIRKSEEELEEARLNEWFYENEIKHPKTVGTIIAEERVELFKKRISTVDHHINLLYAYLQFLESGDGERNTGTGQSPS